MLFRTPLRCARFLKTQSNRRTTALPTGAVRHRTTGVTSASRRILGYQKTALNHLVARLLVNGADNGRDVAALGLARSNRHPANHLQASSRQAMKADLAMLRRHLGDPNWPTTIISYRNADLLGYATYFRRSRSAKIIWTNYQIS